MKTLRRSAIAVLTMVVVFTVFGGVAAAHHGRGGRTTLGADRDPGAGGGPELGRCQGELADARVVPGGCPQEAAPARVAVYRPLASRSLITLRNLPNALNVSFPDLDSETMLMALDLEGICASSGSACMVGSVVASHVLLAMGLPLKLAKSAVRFSLGKFTSAQEINVAVRIILQIIQRTHARHIAQTEHVAI